MQKSIDYCLDQRKKHDDIFVQYEYSYYFYIVNQKGINVELTEKEEDLIAAIRNFKKAQHNPSQTLEIWAIRMFESLMYDDEEE